MPRTQSHGYTLALDDFVYNSNTEPLLEVADIVKIDFQASDYAGLEELVPVLKERRLTMLAEKVESWEEVKLATDLGFTMFQGYYFSKPEVVTAKRLLPLQMVCFELISEVSEPDLDYGQVASIISRDLPHVQPPPCRQLRRLVPPPSNRISQTGLGAPR